MSDMSDHQTPLHLCCLLRARPGAEQELTAYEDKVLSLLPEHGGELLSRVVGDGAEGRPHEVHVYRFAGQGSLDAYMADPRRLALAEERDRVVASTELFPVVPRADR
jgi:antibiotic biosynthesis monooxygenase (ABM) superfamily enzyme